MYVRLSVCPSSKLKFFYSVQICTVQECSRMCHNVSECSTMFQNITECSRRFQKVPEGSRRFWKVPNVPKGSRRFQQLANSSIVASYIINQYLPISSTSSQLHHQLVASQCIILYDSVQHQQLAFLQLVASYFINQLVPSYFIYQQLAFQLRRHSSKSPSVRLSVCPWSIGQNGCRVFQK